MKPPMKPNDVHFVFNARTRVLKCYGPDGLQRWAVPARGEGVAGPGWTMPQGDTPPGLWRVDDLIPTRPEEQPWVREVYGPAFLTLWDCEAQQRRVGRSGIGLHGGRDRTPGRGAQSGAELALTEGCIRVDDDDLMGRVVPAWQYIHDRGGTVWLTVSWE